MPEKPDKGPGPGSSLGIGNIRFGPTPAARLTIDPRSLLSGRDVSMEDRSSTLQEIGDLQEKVANALGNSPPPPPQSPSIDVTDQVAAEILVRRALNLLGMPCEDHSTRKTPERFVKYLKEFFNTVDLNEVLGDGFDTVAHETSIHGMIIQTKIPFRAVCEHHLLPMLGYAHVGYVPGDRIVGISKLTRLVEAYGTEQPTLQEAVTEKVADALFKGLSSKGSIVVIQATHGCMSARGVTAPNVETITSCVRGVFRDVISAREEFFSILGMRRGL